MNKAQEFSTKLLAWVQAHQHLNEWVDRFPEGKAVEEDREEFVRLRRRYYRAEWELVSLGASREVWEKSVPHWFNEQQRVALDNLRASVKDLNFSSQALLPDALPKSGSINGWWFIPYSMWVGHLPAHPVAAFKQLEVTMDRCLMDFRNKLQPRLVEGFEESLQGMEDVHAYQMAIFHTFNASVLRDFPLPSLHFNEWAHEAKVAIQFRVEDPSPYRAGCIAFYLQGMSYEDVAMMRDVIHDIAQEHLPEINSKDIQFGVLQAREQATEEAELMQWDMWAEAVTGDALMAGATHRSVDLKVLQEKGSPRRLLARYRDLRNGEVLHENLFGCEIYRSNMLFHALEIFVECSRPELVWSVERIEASPNLG
jgi:hypothetical protein